MILKNGTVLNEHFDFVNEDLMLDGSIISKSSSDGEVTDCTGCYIVPGLIDIHTHGAMGFDNMDTSFSAVDTISEFMAKNGVTTYLPTLITQSRENMKKSAANIGAAEKRGVCGAKIGGIYMEGPYFSVKHKGAQNEEYLRKPSVTEFDEINAASGNLIKIIAIAPELEGAAEFIREKRGRVKISIGHTDADYETAKSAIDCGVTGITHIFNGMRGFHHREPNVIGAAVDSGVLCECICDGFHISPTGIRFLYKAVGGDRMVLISDSLRAAGMADGEYELGGQKFFVSDGRAKLSDGTIAGSTARLSECVKKAVEFGLPINTAFKAATLNPAKAAGLDAEIGSIKIGKKADLLILNKDLSIKSVIINGRTVL